LIEAAHEWRVDVFVNNAGVYSRGPFAGLSAEDVRDVVAVNLVAPMLLTLGIFPFMAARGSGLIININSVAGRIPNGAEAVYCAAKHGLAGFARSFQDEAIRAGVRILTVYLGAMDTAMTGRQDSSKLIRSDEAAAAIVSACANYESLQVRELVIGRLIY
jgi:short-subunit dehydrogenase